MTTDEATELANSLLLLVGSLLAVSRLLPSEDKEDAADGDSPLDSIEVDEETNALESCFFCGKCEIKADE